MDGRRRLASLAGLALALSATLLACSGNGTGTGEPSESGSAEASTQAETAGSLPLTGLRVDEVPPGPVIAVKVDNTQPAFPQRGIDGADLVVEEPVEGGVTRLVVMFHANASSTPTPVGPVRSIRTSDVGIVAPADAVLYASGGAPIPQEDLAAAGIETRFEESPGFERDLSRGFLHGRFLDVPEALDSLSSAPPPDPYFEWGSAPWSDLPGQPLESFDLVFSPFQTTSMRTTEGGWTRVLTEPDGFVASTVIALSVDQELADYVDPGGFDVPVTITEGTGTGQIAHDGRVVDVVWTKPTPQSRWTFATPDGDDVAIPPGHVYLALLPSTSGSLVPSGGA